MCYLKILSMLSIQGKNTSYFTQSNQLSKAKVNVRLSEKTIAIKSQNTMKAAMTLCSYMKESTICTTDDSLSKLILMV